jgi:signal transduction histidine kinase
MRDVVRQGDSFRRQYAFGAGLFVVLILGIIFLFGHLISRSLSQRYLADTIITGREEARRVAEEIVSEFHVVEKRQELMSRTLQGLPKREVLEAIEVTDQFGQVVFSMNLRSSEELPQEVMTDFELNGSLSDQELIETESSYEIAVPLGEIGRVVGRVSKLHLAERVTTLRRDLMRRTSTVAAITVATLVTAFIFGWYLIQRTRTAEVKRHESEQMAAIGSLAANLAHEIRNPLNSINLNLELLSEDIADNDKQAQSSLESTRQEVGRLTQLVNDFLTYARPNQPSCVVLETAKLVEEVVTFLKPEARQQGVHLTLGKELANEAVRGDASQLRQVLLNLVLNATQAVAPLAAERRVVKVSARSNGDEVTLVVHDRGHGIPDEEMAKVRSAFYTCRPGGTGLGLAIAERIVNTHGGRLELRNLSDSGFEATVALPVTTGDDKIPE